MRVKFVRSVSWLVMTALLLVFAGCRSAPKDDQKSGSGGSPGVALDYFKGKNVTFIIPFSPGGGTDTFARMIAPFLQENLPGSTVVVQNVTGAGGNVGMNKLYTSPSDGLTLGIALGPALIFSQAGRVEGIQYDMGKFTYLARVAAEPRVLTVAKNSRFNRIQDLASGKDPVKYGFTGIGDDDYFSAAIVAKYLGIKMKPVAGYQSGKEIPLAAIRGETDVAQGTFGTLRPLIKSGELKPLMQMTTQRSKEMPEVPTAMELVSDPAAKETVTILTGILQTDKVLLAPPGVPKEKAEALRKAVEKALTDPKFLEQAEKSGRPVDFLPGDRTQKLVEEIMAKVVTLKPLMDEALKLAPGGKS